MESVEMDQKDRFLYSGKGMHSTPVTFDHLYKIAIIVLLILIAISLVYIAFFKKNDPSS